MTTGATGQLGLALPVQGELSGTWGNTVNNGITEYTNIAIAGTLTLTGDGAVTLANTTGDASASNIVSSLTGAGTVTAQFAAVKITGTLTTTKVVTGPSYSKSYVIDNATATYNVTFKASGQTGVTIVPDEKCTVYFNGTDYVKISTSVADGVTSVSVATANGFGGGSSGGTSPSLTLTTSVTGIVKGDGNAISAATAGTDYIAPPSGTAILKANSGGALANATAGTDYLAPPSGTALLKANSGGALANATAGTDYAAPGTSTTFTALQSFNLFEATKTQEVYQTLTHSSSGTLAINFTNGNVVYLNQGANITGFTLSNITSGKAFAFNIVRKNTAGSALTITWGSAFKWPSGGVTPTLTNTTNAIDIFTFITFDGGTTVYSISSGTNFA